MRQLHSLRVITNNREHWIILSYSWEWWNCMVIFCWHIISDIYIFVYIWYYISLTYYLWHIFCIYLILYISDILSLKEFCASRIFYCSLYYYFDIYLWFVFVYFMWNIYSIFFLWWHLTSDIVHPILSFCFLFHSQHLHAKSIFSITRHLNITNYSLHYLKNDLFL